MQKERMTCLPLVPGGSWVDSYYLHNYIDDKLGMSLLFRAAHEL